MQPIPRETGLKTPPFQVFVGKVFPRQAAKNNPFLEKIGRRIRPLVHSKGRGGGGVWHCRVINSNIRLARKSNMSSSSKSVGSVFLKIVISLNLTQSPHSTSLKGENQAVPYWAEY